MLFKVFVFKDLGQNPPLFTLVLYKRNNDDDDDEKWSFVSAMAMNSLGQLLFQMIGVWASIREFGKTSLEAEKTFTLEFQLINGILDPEGCINPVFIQCPTSAMATLEDYELKILQDWFMQFSLFPMKHMGE